MYGYLLLHLEHLHFIFYDLNKRLFKDDEEVIAKLVKKVGESINPQRPKQNRLNQFNIKEICAFMVDLTIWMKTLKKI